MYGHTQKPAKVVTFISILGWAFLSIFFICGIPAFPAPYHAASFTIGTGSFPEGKERPGRDADPSLPSSAVGHERVELYLYSPYGLYRASVPVQGWPLYLYLSHIL